MSKKILIPVLILVLAAAAAGGWYLSKDRNVGTTLTAAFVYSTEDPSYKDMYSQLEQSFIGNLDVDYLPVDKGMQDLTGYDMVFLDNSAKGAEGLAQAVSGYTEEGGSVFLSNSFAEVFEPAFFGAKSIVPLAEIPGDLTYPEVDGDMGELQGLIRDFNAVYKEYTNYDELAQRDYGCGFEADTAVSLADFQGISICGINHYGKGLVFYTNPLLPNFFDMNCLDLSQTSEDQKKFSNSSATGNQLILSEFASYVSKMKYGYSVWKVLGSFTSPDMAWELHYEEITGIQNGSSKLFGDMCMEADTIPSFTLIRNTYKWFTKFESVTYLLDQGDGYQMDLEENAYSSGTHAAEGDHFLSLGEKGMQGSYFEDVPSDIERAYPATVDLNRDGLLDMVCGSSDGSFYYFEGSDNTDRWVMKERVQLTDPQGQPLSVGSASSPAVADLDGDGCMDIVSGSYDGNIYLFRGTEKGNYEPAYLLIETNMLNMTMPALGDVNGDGFADIVFGSLNGVINIFTGTGDGGYLYQQTLECPDEAFVAPWICDLDDDGKTDIIYGTYQGYVRKWMGDGKGGYTDGGFFDVSEKNYKGNNHAKFGNNAVPNLNDINGDGLPDLICGALEYGLAVPIDSPYFPYRKELQEQVDYMLDNHFYLGVHYYTNSYASYDREMKELELHKKAFDDYGIDYDKVGVDMHTWHVSDTSPNQTMITASDSGFLWNIGFQAAYSGAIPQASAESVFSCPFFMDYKDRKMMITNASVLGYEPFDRLAWVSAKYDLPIAEYYHCDFTYEDEAPGRQMIQVVSDYRDQHQYNFVKEDQLMKAAAAAYNSRILTVPGEDGWISLSSRETKKGFDLYDKNYQDCVGVRIDFAENVDVSQVRVDADIWRYDPEKQDLYVGLKGGARVDLGEAASEEGVLITENVPHITGINTPAEVSVKDGTYKIRFREDGMMQFMVSGTVSEVPEGWKAVPVGDLTRLTRFGEADEAEFRLE